MTCFLTSSHCVQGAPLLNPANGFLDMLRESLRHARSVLFITSAPDDVNFTDRVAWETWEVFHNADIRFDRYAVLDRRNEYEAERLVRDADLVFLAGGHVPTQNDFFHDIRLRELLEDFDGVILGVSAGSMNCAEIVYSHPELDGESVDPGFRRFRSGLGLTQTNMIPHYQNVKDDVLDGLHLFWDIAVPDSVGNRFYALPDGSFIYSCDGYEELRGEAYLLEGGAMRKISREGDAICLSY